jgi:glutathione S-transferase
MMPMPGKMILRSTPTSPFSRKVKIASLLLGLADRIVPEFADPLKPDDTLRQQNPLGKMPTLLLEDGGIIYDSVVIHDYLDQLAGGGKIVPADPMMRREALTLQALGDGIMDAAILIVYEGRHRPPEKHHEPWLDYQRGKIVRALSALDATPPVAEPNVGTIALACALGYLDWRKQVDWRPRFANLVGWLDAFRAAVPAFDQTYAAPRD